MNEDEDEVKNEENADEDVDKDEYNDVNVDMIEH